MLKSLHFGSLNNKRVDQLRNTKKGSVKLCCNKSCWNHVFEVKKFKILSKPEKALTSILLKILLNSMQIVKEILKVIPKISNEIVRFSNAENKSDKKRV